jgi:NAD(P)-dependent dehydrogenase (short-subunit alcohol dehydrogenase family)
MSNGLFDLSGKVTLVTGGNGGLGLGFARGIAKQGGNLEIWGRSSAKNAAAKEELEAFGVRVSARQVDVASEQEVIAGYDALMAEFGRVDCVIANSGISPNANSLLEMTTEEYHGLLGINMHGAFYTLREGARKMVERAEAGEPGGSLVFCGSLSMFQGIPGKQNYAAAKAGMGAAIRCMAVEFGKHGIRANSIAPGYIKTEMTGEDEVLSPIDQYFASKTPIPRPGYPADFEGIAAYLASDASSWHTGDTIVIDGAALINM